MRVLPLLVLLLPSLAAAQATDDGTFVVKRADKEIGREVFSVRPQRDRGAGSTLTVTAKYPDAKTQLEATLQRTETGGLASLRLKADGPDGPTSILAAGAGARLLLRSSSGGAETGRELPAGPDVILLDDNLYALFVVVADAANAAGKRVTAIYPRTGRRVTFTARKEAGAGGGSRVALAGDVAGTLTLDAAGRVTRMEFPANGTAVTRLEP